MSKNTSGIKLIDAKLVRVRFRNKKNNKLKRPIKLVEATYKEVGYGKSATITKYMKFHGVYGYVGDEENRKKVPIPVGEMEFSKENFVTEWEKGPTPTPKPLRNYNNEKLMEMGYCMAQIQEIRGRKYSSKDVKLAFKLFKGTKSNKEVKALLDKYGTYGKLRNSDLVSSYASARKDDLLGKHKLKVKADRQKAEENRQKQISEAKKRKEIDMSNQKQAA